MENLSADIKNILGLQLPSDPRWVNLAELQLEEILTDHAYCEQKAATTCISLITKNPEKELLVDELSPIVTEEWGHFRMVIAELKKQNLKLGKQRKAGPGGLSRREVRLQPAAARQGQPAGDLGCARRRIVYRLLVRPRTVPL